jgi:hypothetical protein
LFVVSDSQELKWKKKFMVVCGKVRLG